MATFHAEKLNPTNDRTQSYNGRMKAPDAERLLFQIKLKSIPIPSRARALPSTWSSGRDEHYSQPAMLSGCREAAASRNADFSGISVGA